MSRKKCCFDNATHKNLFLAGINAFYGYRDGDNWSACIDMADDLIDYATGWVDDESVARNVAEICGMVVAIYGEDSSVFDDVMKTKKTWFFP